MKKSFFFVAALALTLVACNKNEPEQGLKVASFEDITVAGANSELKLDTTGTFTSGDFTFKQTAMPSMFYYSCHVVSNHKDTTFVDYNDAWKSIAGGAHAGNNYVVWNKDFYGADTVKLNEAAIIPGFYVTNSVYAYASITKGDWSGPAFKAEDWFLLTIKGSLNGVAVNNEVKFYLAQGTEVVKDWEYVDLSTLGKVDAITFSLTGSRTGEYGLNTPAYFCYDDLGAKKELK